MMQLCDENLIKAIAIGLILLGTSAWRANNGDDHLLCLSDMFIQQIMATYCTLKIKDPETKARPPPIFVVNLLERM